MSIATKVGLVIALAIGGTLTMPVGRAEAAALPVVKSTADDAGGLVAVRYRGGRGGGRYYGGYGYGYGGYNAPPVYLYAAPPVVHSYRSSGGHCAWLRQRARETGSRYWWNRYRNEC